MDKNINQSTAKKSAMISARFTPDEHKTIKDEAAKAGVKISKYARLMILTGKVVQRFTGRMPTPCASFRARRTT